MSLFDALMAAMAIVVMITLACLAYSALFAIEWAKQDLKLRREEANRRLPRNHPDTWADKQK